MEGDFYDGHPWRMSEHREEMKKELVSFVVGSVTVELECENATAIAEAMREPD